MKPKKDAKPVTAADIAEYARGNSDFSFEMQVLKTLNRLQCSCEHGGNYVDPVTGKNRQYDIRASRAPGSYCTLFAVECKNLRDSFPLIIHSVPRPEADSFHEFLVAENVEFQSSPYHSTQQVAAGWKTVRTRIEKTPYEKLGHVGKHMDQVGHDDAGAVQSAGDGKAYEKFSQAINSSAELIDKAVANVHTRAMMATAVLPVLVVPDSCLWELQYDDTGNTQGEPKQVDHVPFLIRQSWTRDTAYGKATMMISHIEIVTLGGLKTLIQTLGGTGLFF